MAEIISQKSFIKIRKSFPEKQKVVLVTGVFDMFHRAHQAFLKKAHECGDILIVGVESDERVKQMKGEGRPKETLNQRIQKISDESEADYVFALPKKFDTSEERELFIRQIHPDILAVSAHSPFVWKKRKVMEKYGGKLEIVMEQDETISTTQLLEGIS